MKANYHTHHELCGHAVGKCEEYVQEAIKQEFEVLGFSDHTPNKRVNDFGVRMKTRELEGYLQEIEAVQKKYKNQITIKKGLEVEYFDDHEDFYLFLKDKTDYLILGQHYISMTDEMDNLVSGFALKTDEHILQYAKYACLGMEKGHFAILAHPDLYMCGYNDWNKTAISVAHQICKTAEATNTILEFNGNGFRRGLRNTPQGKTQPYPRLEFWNIVKQYDIKTILSSDCHTPEFLYDTTMKEVEVVYQNLGLNTIEFLDI